MNTFVAKRLLACLSLLIVSLFSISACSPSQPNAAQPAAPAMWGDMKPVVSVKDLMRNMIDPASDYIFDAVKVEMNKSGTVERLPKTDADWERIRTGAITLAEGIYLLKVPRPFAPPGDENNSSGPEATELSPAQIKAKIEADPVLWNAKIEALRNVGLEVLEIVNKKNTDALFEAGGNLDEACESCHIQYWYPGDKALLEKVDRGLRELYERPGSEQSSPKTRK